MTRWRSILWVAAALGAGLPVSAEIVQATEAGTLHLAVPTLSDGWEARQPDNQGDLLFGEGVTLVVMREPHEGGAMVTISLDQNHPMGPEAQAAFLALARDREREGRMAVWPIGEWTWIVQEFRSPSERVLAAQVFVGPYVLAYLFWLDPDGEEAAQDDLARDVLRRWGPRWQPTPAAEAAPSGAQGR